MSRPIYLAYEWFDFGQLCKRCVCLSWTGMTSWSFAVPIITRPPQSAVRNVGGSVDLNCGVSEIYDNYFEWRRYQSPDRGSPSQQIYSMYNNSAFSWASDLRAHRFRRVGQYGLSVRPLMASDGATYECQFYSWNLFKSANVFVIGTSVGF